MAKANSSKKLKLFDLAGQAEENQSYIGASMELLLEHVCSMSEDSHLTYALQAVLERVLQRNKELTASLYALSR
jgi:hypothetical protein